MSLPESRSHKFRVIAQDPRVRNRYDTILTTTVTLAPEELAVGPWGYRVQVIDFDSSTDRLHSPLGYERGALGSIVDPFADAPDDALRNDFRFHAQNAYALVMRTVARFEYALGRRVNWGFDGHQIKIVPHAFADANAFYSREDEALLFGYFPSFDNKRTIYTCLSHDVVVHETTHALLDGLRERFIDPSSADQAAFHEGFADVVALLSVFSLRGVVEEILFRNTNGHDSENLIDEKAVTADALKSSVLLGLADEMGEELEMTRGRALRRSVELEVSPRHYVDDPDFKPAHRRGEILVAAVMNAFLGVWVERLEGLRKVGSGKLDLQRVAEEGREAADYLLTMAIRALDYTPPVHVEFCDYLSALITADVEVRPDESRFRFREHLRQSFRDFGIVSATGTFLPTPKPGEIDKMSAAVQPPEEGSWVACGSLPLVYDRTHFDPMAHEPDEVFRFLWENRKALHLFEGAFSQVLSVRPALRIAPDGFALKETVVEFYQVIRLRRDELQAFGIAPPEIMADSDEVPLYGGGTLIFDEYRRLKYYIHNSLDNIKRQQVRLDHLFASGALPETGRRIRDFARMHRLRAFGTSNPQEEW